MSGSGVTGGVPVAPEVNGAACEPRRVSSWQVACINWNHADAPHAVAYYIDGGAIAFTRYFGAWSDAIEWADWQARRFTR